MLENKLQVKYIEIPRIQTKMETKSKSKSGGQGNYRKQIDTNDRTTWTSISDYRKSKQ